MRRRAPLAAVAIALSAVVGGVVGWRCGGCGASPPAAIAATVRPAANPALARFPRLASLVAAAPASPRAGLHMLDDPRLPVAVADYLIASRFPPDSRPLEPGMLDLIEPNRRNDTPGPVERADRTLGDPSLRVLWTGDRFWLLGGEAIAVWLEVTRDGARVPVAVRSARARAVEVVTRADVGLEVPLALTEDASHVWTGSFSVAGTPLARHVGYVHLDVTYDTDGDGGEPPGVVSLEVYVQPDDDPPARFTGRYRDQLVDGSLIVHAGVDVARAGDYIVDANVYDAAGHPAAFVRWKGRLPAGPGEVPLRLFGRVVREADAPAPFTFTDVRGYRWHLGADPDRELMAAAPDHVTPAYPATAFRADEFWDEAKQRHVDALLGEARRGTHTMMRTTLGEAIDAGWAPGL